MRFLKKKVCLRQDEFNEDSEFELSIANMKTECKSTVESSDSFKYDTPLVLQESPLPLRKPRKNPSSPEGKSKNIIKNYGKAMCSFASSKLALPYLQNIILKNQWDCTETSGFVDYINSQKNNISSIESVRKLLVGDHENEPEVAIYKKMFQEISIIFLKFFSVNWIYGGRLLHKKAHMRYRFKMLRRIQDPVHFTYLQSIKTR